MRSAFRRYPTDALQRSSVLRRFDRISALSDRCDPKCLRSEGARLIHATSGFFHGPADAASQLRLGACFRSLGCIVIVLRESIIILKTGRGHHESRQAVAHGTIQRRVVMSPINIVIRATVHAYDRIGIFVSSTRGCERGGGELERCLAQGAGKGPPEGRAGTAAEEPRRSEHGSPPARARAEATRPPSPLGPA